MIELRPYQVADVRAVHQALRQVNRVVLTAPTGSGKRLVACWWATHIAAKGKTLGVVTDRRQLVRQIADECNAHGIEYGLRMGSEPRHESAPVQICSIQTLKARDWHDLPHAEWWIIDEAHKEAAAYQTLLDLYPKSKVVGLTATPVGSSGRSLRGLYDRIVEPTKNTELIRAGWLLPTVVKAPSEPDLKGITISSASGEYVQTQLGKRVEECTVFADVFKWWEPYRECATIVFAPRVMYARGLAEQFTQRGHVAEVIEAATTARDRRDVFEAFNDGDVKVLVSVDVLREGFDAPIARVGIDLQPNNQLRTYWQKIGRVKRPHEGQETAIWLDFAGNFWKFPHPDEDPEWPSGQETTQDIIKKKREEEERKPWACAACSYVLSPWEQLINGECPQCGHKTTKPIRHIRMSDGSMKTISAIDRKKKKVNQDQRIWDACRYKAHYSRKTLSFARWLFHEQTGRWPAKLKACPDQDSGDWKRRPIDVYPFMARR